MGEEVKVLGAWASPYSCKVIWALKLKGIPFEYIEQDLVNKSHLLLQSNPVYKKVPVLLHNGNPISESMIIVEYLDQIWPQHPLLPSHPYDRALSRFWVKFLNDKVLLMWMIYRTSGEEQERAVKATLEMLKTIEEEAMGIVGANKHFGGENIGIVDIAFGEIAHWMGVIENIAGIRVLEPHNFPKLHSWIQNFKQAPIICDNLPDPEKMLTVFKPIREKILASASSLA